jgi:hypothetical protein
MGHDLDKFTASFKTFHVKKLCNLARHKKIKLPDNDIEM